MRVIEIGNIGERATLDNMPKTGIIIEATVEELKKLPQCLYREVEITTKESVKLDRKEVRETEGEDE